VGQFCVQINTQTMAKTRAARFDSADALIDDLEESGRQYL
jgi:hypothetical protein